MWLGRPPPKVYRRGVTPSGTTAGSGGAIPLPVGKARSPLDCEAHPPNRDGFPSTLETQAWRMAACFCSTDKRYSGDNRLMVPQRRHRRNRLAPRCRLTPSRGCRRSQGLDCSSIKGVRELGLDRRESGWPLSTAAGGALGEGHLRTKGAGGGGRWCSGRAFAKASSRSYAAGPDGAPAGVLRDPCGAALLRGHGVQPPRTPPEHAPAPPAASGLPFGAGPSRRRQGRSG